MPENPNPVVEIARLGKIIAVLVNEIEDLKRQNLALKEIIGINNDENSLSLTGIRPPNVMSTFAEKSNGSPDNMSTIAEKVDMPPHFMSTVTEKSNGSPKDMSAVAEKGKGRPDNVSAIAEKGNASPNIMSTIAEKGSTQNSVSAPLGKIAPANIHNGGPNIYPLGVALEKYFHTDIKRETLYRVARQLLHLHNNGSAPATELYKISALSRPGFDKHIPKLKRLNLVTRQGYGNYSLTPTAKALINEVFGV